MSKVKPANKIRPLIGLLSVILLGFSLNSASAVNVGLKPTNIMSLASATACMESTIVTSANSSNNLTVEGVSPACVGFPFLAHTITANGLGEVQLGGTVTASLFTVTSPVVISPSNVIGVKFTINGWNIPTLWAYPPPVDLKSAEAFSVVAADYITLATSTSVNRNAAAGAAITKGNPSAVGGITHAMNDVVAQQAIIDVREAYDDASTRPATTISGTLDGQTLTPGVYHAVAAFGLAAAGKVTLDGRGNPNAVFILKTNGAIVTGATSEVVLINGAKASNIFWQTPTHIVFGANTIFSGNLLAQSYITFGAGAQLTGRALSLGYISTDAALIITPFE